MALGTASNQNAGNPVSTAIGGSQTAQPIPAAALAASNATSGLNVGGANNNLSTQGQGTSTLPLYQGQLVNGYAPVSGYSNSNPNQQPGVNTETDQVYGQSPVAGATPGTYANQPTPTPVQSAPAAQDPADITAWFNSLSPLEQQSVNSVASQYGGDLLAAGKAMIAGGSSSASQALYQTALTGNAGPAAAGGAANQPANLPANLGGTVVGGTPTTTYTDPITGQTISLNGTNPATTTPASNGAGSGESGSTGASANSGTGGSPNLGTPATNGAGAGDTSGGSATSNIATQMQGALSALQSGSSTAPASQGTASAAVAGATPPVISPTPQPDPKAAQVVLDNNAAYQNYINDYNNYMSSASQQTSLTQDYQTLSQQLGLPAMNTEMMNMQNIIQGTSSDLESEINKAGGFATASQMMALSTSRNSQVIKNYNALSEIYKDSTSQLTTMIGLDEKDRAAAQTQITNQLNYDQKMIDTTTTALKNAQDGLTTMQKSEGWDGIYAAALASGDPNAISNINSTMGNGFDLATMAKADAATRATTNETAALKNEQLQSSINTSASDIQKNNAAIASSNATTAKTNLDIQNEEGTTVPDPAKANQTGYDATGLKYTPASAAQEAINGWKSQGFINNKGYVSAPVYKQAEAWWVSQGLSSTDFTDIMAPYTDAKNQAAYKITS